MRRKYLLVLATVLLCVDVVAQVIRVPADYASIQTALDSANAGDTILVSPGTYAEHLVWPTTQGLKLLSEGDSSNTFIDAGLTGRPLTVQAQAPGLDSNTLVRGFTFMNGLVYGNGGGVLLQNASIVLDGVSISDNMAISNIDSSYGGGLCLVRSHALIRNSTVSGNVLQAVGLGIGAGIGSSGSNPDIRHTLISDNRNESPTYGYGGGMGAVYSSRLILEACTVSGNTLRDSCNWTRGAGIYCSDIDSLDIHTSRIHHNTFGAFGGYNYGAGVCARFFRHALIRDTRIDSNSTGFKNLRSYGTGLYLFNGSTLTGAIARLQNVVISNNVTGDSSDYSSQGAGLFVQALDSLLAYNVLIADNLFGKRDHYDNGGGACLYNSYFDLRNVTIAYNRSPDTTLVRGPGIYLDGQTEGRILNSILWNPNNNAEIYNQNSQVIIDRSDVRGPLLGTNNLNLDPLFVGPNDYRLSAGSPCLGFGSMSYAPPTDLLGNPRPMPAGTDPDLGAYETDQSMSIHDKGSRPLQIYPNPASDRLYIRPASDMKQVSTVRIFGMAGQVILEEGTPPGTTGIDVSALPPGLYLLELQTGRERRVARFVVDRNSF